jgi:hypothetical protein
MTEKRKRTDAPATAQPFRIRLPGFLLEEEIGMGSVIKRVTAAAGIPACGACRKRAEILDRWVAFHPRQPK